jgi:hypothetical protein
MTGGLVLREPRCPIERLLAGRMSRQEITVPAAEFISACHALSAAGPGFARKTVVLHFRPKLLELEGEMGGGVVETDGDFELRAAVTCGKLAKAASLHRKYAGTAKGLRLVLDPELGEDCSSAHWNKGKIREVKLAVRLIRLTCSRHIRLRGNA